jgi:benzoyl-CoA reductase/2-hydroxyglutaryl-CoA dehydratase subunit BcrC/BadD/HgdB
MSNTQELLSKFNSIATNPSKQKDAYLAAGEKIVLTAPVYTPEEIIHSMGLIPMGAWGGTLPLQKSREYFPAFICSIAQSILELGMNDAFKGASAIVIPPLCDCLRGLGQNWKYAVPTIPFIPMSYPQNRANEVGIAFCKAGYERVISDLEKATGARFDDTELAKSIQIYNEHNVVMREVDKVLATHPEISAAQRSSIFKSAFFIEKGEHTVLVKELLDVLKHISSADAKKIPVMTSGILCDAPDLLEIFDRVGLQIVADDVAAESRQYRTDAPGTTPALDALAEKFSRMDNCSVLFDADKKRADLIVETAKQRGARGVVIVLTKFCPPEEFDYVIIKKACNAAKLPHVMIEVDRQMTNYEQARTALETFRDVLQD